MVAAAARSANATSGKKLEFEWSSSCGQLTKEFGCCNNGNNSRAFLEDMTKIKKGDADTLVEARGHHIRGSSFFNEEDVVELIHVTRDGSDLAKKESRLHTPPNSSQPMLPRRRKLDDEGSDRSRGEIATSTLTEDVRIGSAPTSAAAPLISSVKGPAGQQLTNLRHSILKTSRVSTPATSTSTTPPTSTPPSPRAVGVLAQQVDSANVASANSRDVPMISPSSTTTSSSSTSNTITTTTSILIQKRERRSVTFAEEEVSLGYALAPHEYNRSAIVVDLSKTPYALFRKDALLLKNPEEASPRTLSPHKSCHAWSDEDIRSASAEFDDLADEAKEIKPNFSGVWQRSNEEGYLDLLVFSGVKLAAARHAVRKRPLHVIDHDEDYLRLIVKNGLSKVDRHYIIGEECREDASVDTEVNVYWGDGTGDGLSHQIVISSTNRSSNTETIAVRELLDGGDTLVLRQVVRKLQTGEECHAKHTFTKIKSVEALRSTRL